MKQLTTPPNETYAVIVPKGAKEKDYTKAICDGIWNTFDVIPKEFNWKILGTVTSESIDFDVSGIVESDRRLLPFVYKNYVYDTIAKDSHDSFRSLLKSKGVEIGENEKVVVIQKR